MAAEQHIVPGKRFRLGGLVQPGSLKCGDGAVTFDVADGSAKMPVAYKGDLPDLFREGQGVVAEGALDADRHLPRRHVLAKHDENYMPREVVDALKKPGHWQDETGATVNISPPTRCDARRAHDRRNRPFSRWCWRSALALCSRRAALRRARRDAALMAWRGRRRSRSSASSRSRSRR